MRGSPAILMRDESHAFDPQSPRTNRLNKFLSCLTVSSPRGSQRHPADNREYATASHCSAPAVAASRENPPFRASSSTKRFYRSRRPPPSLYTHSRGCSRATRRPTHSARGAGVQRSMVLKRETRYHGLPGRFLYIDQYLARRKPLHSARSLSKRSHLASPAAIIANNGSLTHRLPKVISFIVNSS